MPCVRRLQCCIERVKVADFANQNHVRILTQHATQCGTEAECVGANFALAHVAANIAVQKFHRIFDRDHVGSAVLIHVMDHRRQRGALARSGDAGDENQTTRAQCKILNHGRQLQFGHGARLIRNAAQRE